MHLEFAMAALLFGAALGIYLWGHARRRARRSRSARRFAGALVNRYGLDAQARASQQLERAVTERERAFRRDVLEALAKPGRTMTGPGGVEPDIPVGAPRAPKVVPEHAGMDLDTFRRARLSRTDLYFFVAAALAAGGAILLIVYG